jgi:hypothetical protein
MIEIKRGDTFAFYANITDELGDPLVTDVANIASQIRDTLYNLVAELTVATTETPGRYLFTAPSTDAWPAESRGWATLYMDIQLNVGGQVSSSDTIEIRVMKDVTYNE